jgi:hypothetical protein
MYAAGDPAARALLRVGLPAAASAYTAANADLKANGRQMLYCQPKHLSLTPDQLIDMIKRGIAEDNTIRAVPIALAMLEVFKRTFPCDEQK